MFWECEFSNRTIAKRSFRRCEFHVATVFFLSGWSVPIPPAVEWIERVRTHILDTVQNKKMAYLVMSETMKLLFPPDASMEEIEAIVERGLNHLYSARFDINDDISFPESYEGEVEGEQRVSSVTFNKNDYTSIHYVIDEVVDANDDGDGGGVVVKTENSCTECGENPCVFFLHKELSLHSTEWNMVRVWGRRMSSVGSCTSSLHLCYTETQ
jgi:hypothetical protein